MNTNSTIELLLDDARGIYIPQAFYEGFDFGEWGLNVSDYTELSSPDNEGYWDAWDELLQNAEHHVKPTENEEFGHTWRLEQDGCLFAVRDDHETTENENTNY